MWRELTPADFGAVMALRQEVIAELGHPDMYVRETQEHEFVMGHLGIFGVSYGYEENGTLVAYCAMTTDLSASGEDVEFDSCIPQASDVVFAAAMVLPRYRGRSLHRAAIRLRMKGANQIGASRALVQVSPHNIPSLRTLFSESFRCIEVATYLDGRFRMLLARTVTEASEPGLLENLSLVDLQDYDRIQAEIHSGRQAHGMVETSLGGLLVVGS